MRIDSTLLPVAAREHGRAHKAERPFHGKAAENPVQAAETRQPEANSAAQANSAARPEAPSGLLAVLAKLQAMDAESLNRGQAQALSSIERNLARYRAAGATSEEAAPQPAAETDAQPAAMEEPAKVDTTV